MSYKQKGEREMRYQYEIAASDGENETISIHFNHIHCGWLIMPKEEVKNLIKFLKARYKHQYVDKQYSIKSKD